MRQNKAKIVIASTIVLAAVTCLGKAGQDRPLEINELLMNCTFRLVGEASEGTAFLLAEPVSGQQGVSRIVMVTAAHVLTEMKGETGALFMRRKVGPSSWKSFIVTFRIRDGDRALWITHPRADVAVAYINVPAGILDTLPSTDMLAGDTQFASYEIHPGDELFALGYPLGAQSSDSGFPILRSGKIASYPLLPTQQIGVFLFDMRVFPGNSGGPVYFTQSNRTYGGGFHFGTVSLIVGVITKQRLATQQISELYAKREQSYPLELAEVVPASLIKETIDMLAGTGPPH